MSGAPEIPVDDLVRSPVADRLMTAEDVAERWQVRPAQVYRLTRDGRLTAVRIGRYYRYRLSSIEAFELEGGVGADA